MATHRHGRHRALTGCACALLAALVAGCTTAAPAPTATGTSLAVYLSDPADLGSDPTAADVVDAERLAFTQLGSQVHGFTLTLHVLSAGKLSDNARAAIENNNAVAYLGEIVPGSSEDTVGITNALDLLQISPTDNALELTQRTAAIKGAPSRYYEDWSTYGHTFAHMVPASAHEAVALLHEMESLGVKTLHIEAESTDYARSMRSVIAGNAAAAALSLGASSASDAVLYLGSSRTAAAAALDAAAAANPKVKLFVPSTLADSAFAAQLSPAAQKALYACSPGFLSRSLPAAGQAFTSSFQATYHHAPAPQAIFGYAAVQALLHVLRQAGAQANNRGTVVADFMKLSYAGSVLGSYTIKQGDISLDSFVIEHVKSGGLVPFKALQG